MTTNKNSQKPKQKITNIKRPALKPKLAQEKAGRQMKVTIYFGYALFALTLIGLCVLIIPMMQRLYPSPYFQDSQLTLMFLTLAFTTLAPSLVGYMAGDSATRGKSKMIHHYNGVLFGVLGMWMWFFVTLLGTAVELVLMITVETAIQDALLRMAPAVIAAITTIVLAVFYAKATRHKVSLIEYHPYQWAIMGSAVASVLALAATSLSGLGYGGNPVSSLLINLIMPTLVLLVLGLIGYWLVGKKSGTASGRIIYSLVAMVYGFVAGAGLAQITMYLTVYRAGVARCVLLVAFIVWVAYLYLLRRASR